jgi:hypothetical protein
MSSNYPKNYFSASLFISIALVASTFTQLRFFPPFGFSDIFFVSFIVYAFYLTLLVLLRNKNPTENNDSPRDCLLPILSFLIIYLLLIFSGTIYADYLINNSSDINLVGGRSMFNSPYHNILAHSYIVLIFMAMYIKADLDIMLTGIYTVIGLSTLVTIFFIISIFENNIFDINLYYLWTDRLMLFTKSPNHLADFIAPLPFLLIYFINHFKSTFVKFFICFLIIFVLLAGFQSSSKATILAWILGGFYLTFASVLAGKYARIIIGAFIFIFVLIMIVLLNLNGDTYITKIEKIWSNDGLIVLDKVLIYDLLIRLQLFVHGLDVGNISPFIGLGAGASSGIFETLDGRESHNHLSETIMTSGYLGFIAYFALMIHIGIKASIKPVLMTVFIVLTITTMFHGQLRQPLFWFYFVFIIFASSKAQSINKILLAKE